MVFPTDAIQKEEEIRKTNEKEASPPQFEEIQNASLLPRFKQLNDELMQLLSEAIQDEKDEIECSPCCANFEKTFISPIHEESLEKKEIEALQASSQIFSNPPISVAASSQVEKIVVSFSPEVRELFEKMVGTMIVMNDSGIQETRILLNSENFSSSSFYGTEILIQEYSTAPKTFNVQLISTSANVELIRNHIPTLMHALKANDFGFNVHRFESFISSEKIHLVRRKESASDDKQEGQKK
jgi:hypothetical protein